MEVHYDQANKPNIAVPSLPMDETVLKLLQNRLSQSANQSSSQNQNPQNHGAQMHGQNRTQNQLSAEAQGQRQSALQNIQSQLSESFDNNSSDEDERSTTESVHSSSENTEPEPPPVLTPEQALKNQMLLASLSSTLQSSWPNNAQKSPASNPKTGTHPLLSSLLRSASLASKSGSLDDPADKILIKELVINEDPMVRVYLNNVKHDGGLSLRQYVRKIKERHMNPERERRQLNQVAQSPLKDSPQKAQQERTRLENNLRKTFQQVERVRKKMVRLGGSPQTASPPPPPMPSPNSVSPSTPGSSQSPLFMGMQNIPRLNMSMQNTLPTSPLGTASVQMPVGFQQGIKSEVTVGGFQELGSQNLLPRLNPTVQPQMNLATMPTLNTSNSMMGFFPMGISQLQQTAQLNALLLSQLASQTQQNGNTNTPSTSLATAPHLDAMQSLLPANSYLPESLGARSKRERPQSMGKMVSLPELTRQRQVNLHNNDLSGAARSPLSVSESTLSMSSLAHSITSASSDPGNISRTNPRHSDSAIKKVTKQRPDIAINTRVYNKSKNHVSAAPRRWTKAEDDLLRAAVKRHHERNWKAISNDVPGRNHVQCLQRWRKALDPSVVKGHWTAHEDQRLLALVAENPKNWGHVARGIPGRTAKQCRERYHNHLDPSIKKGDWTEDEDAVIIDRQKVLGNKWAEISKFLPGRTENSVKIRWKSIQRQSQAGYNSRRPKKEKDKDKSIQQ